MVQSLVERTCVEFSNFIFFQNQMVISEQKARGEKLSQTKDIRIYTALKMG